KETKTAKKKRKLRSGSSEASPRKGEAGEIWTWPLYKTQLPVTCGEVEGTLIRDKLAKGEKCIQVDKQRFTPSEFEKFAGKGSAKNWKLSIRCKDTPLGKLIKVCSVLQKKNQTGKREETEEQGEPTQVGPDHYRSMFRVTCGALTGTLYKCRFASGKCGKSIRTEVSWMSPEEFVNTALNQRDASWRKDILYKGEPLSVLLEAKVLTMHSLLCKCKRCKPKPEDLDDDKNDDKCCICKSEGEEDLVECDKCPRSFHQNCHLPHIDGTVLGVIKTPMWLEKIAGKLQRSEYQTVGGFVSDVQLIFTNSATYNRVSKRWKHLALSYRKPLNIRVMFSDFFKTY
uniref:SP110 nuclear body protein, tandem duplicate 2 n=1 Tax=Xiphophorus couchianus TaxID=32473 RepID=A0A3B5MI37_9TELE